MPVDPVALFNAILDGLSTIPPGILAAILLGGPTAIWLILQFGNPPEARTTVAQVSEELLWVCVACRSINKDLRDNCYRCHRLKTDESEPTAPGVARPPLAAPRIGIGIAVGPGRPFERPMADSWLGLEPVVPVVAASRTDDPLETGADGGRQPQPEPELKPAPEAAQDVDNDEDDEDDELDAVNSLLFDPVILEPKVKVSARQPASRATTASTSRPEATPGPRRRR
jgi:hypothetical protein